MTSSFPSPPFLGTADCHIYERWRRRRGMQKMFWLIHFLRPLLLSVFAQAFISLLLVREMGVCVPAKNKGLEGRWPCATGKESFWFPGRGGRGKNTSRKRFLVDIRRRLLKQHLYFLSSKMNKKWIFFFTYSRFALISKTYLYFLFYFKQARWPPLCRPRASSPPPPPSGRSSLRGGRRYCSARRWVRFRHFCKKFFFEFYYIFFISL